MTNTSFSKDSRISIERVRLGEQDIWCSTITSGFLTLWKRDSRVFYSGCRCCKYCVIFSSINLMEGQQTCDLQHQETDIYPVQQVNFSDNAWNDVSIMTYFNKLLYRRLGLEGILDDFPRCLVVLHKWQIAILNCLTRKL